MQYLADLHIHSRFAFATSRRINLPLLYKWAKIKGVNILATGDFTHPAWLAEIKDYLKPLDNGLFTLKSEYSRNIDTSLPKSVQNNSMYFVLSTEISCIYKKFGKTRKIHSVVLMPGLQDVIALQSKLSKYANLSSDGRPILGIDVKDLLDIVLNINPNSLFIPAHIWTPWFGVLGSKSGFNSIEEAFEDLSKYIYAVETGLSSDPAMNWRLSSLDKFTLVSNSDAHSAENIGREANILQFDSDISYSKIVNAIKTKSKHFVGTIEFHPEEGRYHFDGHRKCNVSLHPAESYKLGGICPKCHKPLVIGVLNRVVELADRPEGFEPKIHKKVEYGMPLREIIAQALGAKNPKSKKVENVYFKLINDLGSEFDILRRVDLTKISDDKIKLGIKNLREGNVRLVPGYDGVYGIVDVLNVKDHGNKDNSQLQMQV